MSPVSRQMQKPMVLETIFDVAGLLAGGPVGDALLTICRYFPRNMLDGAKAVVGDWMYLGKAWLVGAFWVAVCTAIGLYGLDIPGGALPPAQPQSQQNQQDGAENPQIRPKQQPIKLNGKQSKCCFHGTPRKRALAGPSRPG